MDSKRVIDNKGARQGDVRTEPGRPRLPMFQIDDILAALLLSLIMFRRLEVLTVLAEDNRHVAEEKFQAWRSMALGGYKVGAIACATKVVLNQVWFFVVRDNPGWWVTAGGLSIFAGWVIGLVWAWRRSTEANAIRYELQIQRKAPPPRR